jgi:predicted peptidase
LAEEYHPFQRIAGISRLDVSVPTGFVTSPFPHPDAPRLYQVYVPSGYDPARAWPVILFLHGAGEGGRDALLPTEYQLGSAIRRHASAFPGLVVFPQLQRYQPLWTSEDVDYALDVLGAVREAYTCDPNRLYITGVSTGARATWHALYRHPELFAAALIVAGVVRPRRPDGTLVPDPDPVVPDVDGDPPRALARRLRLPIWAFHGDDDPVFPVQDTRDVVAALTSAGVPVRYTELAAFGHDVWDVAYYSPEVAAWLFAQRRTR